MSKNMVLILKNRLFLDFERDDKAPETDAKAHLRATLSPGPTVRGPFAAITNCA